MASKGQKFKKLDPEAKKEILKKYFDGDVGPTSLGEMYDVSVGTVKNLIRKTKKGADVTIDHRKGGSGRPKTKSLTLEDYKERYKILKKYRAFLEARQGKK